MTKLWTDKTRLGKLLVLLGLIVVLGTVGTTVAAFNAPDAEVHLYLLPAGLLFLAALIIVVVEVTLADLRPGKRSLFGRSRKP